MRIYLPYRIILLVAFVTMALVASGQTVVNDANVYVPTDLQVYVDGNLTNAGFFQNLGTIHFTGDWKNTNVYQGAGTLVIMGDRAQTVNNNGNAVYKIVVDGSGNKIIEEKLPVTNTLQLVSGIIFVTENDTLLLSNTATVTGGSSQSYVDGALFSEGVGFRYFPIGKNGKFHPIELVNITGISPVISLEVFENLSPINLPDGITPYRDIWWRREDVSGTFTSSPVVIGYDIPGNRNDTHQIDILESDDESETFATLGTTSVETGNPLDKIISEERPLTKKIFLIGESIPIGGVEGAFYLSNTLSPQATTEANRTIKVFGNQLELDGFQFVVYNRWGLVVFESSSLQEMLVKGWDGKKSGDFLPAGAYPYMLKGRLKTGEKLEKKGIISIVN